MMNLIQKIAANKIRKEFGGFDKKRDEGQTTPSDIKRFDNITYGDDPKWLQWQLLDVYRPKDVEGKLPVIVSVHGGGWVYGNKDVYQFYCMRLAQRGFAVVNFSYRLAPEKIFPAAIEDTEKVFNWICNNADQYGLNRVFLNSREFIMFLQLVILRVHIFFHYILLLFRMMNTQKIIHSFIKKI